MSRSIACRQPTLLLTGMLCSISAAGCSKGAERSPTVETASSDTSKASKPDTTVTPRTPVDSTVPSPAAQKGKMNPTPPKPNIDPGRKGTGRIKVPRPAPSTSQSEGVKYDAATNTVTFELMAGPFNFNGFTNGAATLTVPSMANLVMNFVNKDGTPHSAEIISGDGPIPNAAVEPAIPRAYTNKVLEGLPQEAKDVMRFTVPASGKYRIFCGVPGHGLSGMWIWLVVDAAAKNPSFGPTKT